MFNISLHKNVVLWNLINNFNISENQTVSVKASKVLWYVTIVSFSLLDSILHAAQGKPVSFKWDPQYSTLKAVL
jgi:hypothetical protein